MKQGIVLSVIAVLLLLKLIRCQRELGDPCAEAGELYSDTTLMMQA